MCRSLLIYAFRGITRVISSCSWSASGPFRWQQHPNSGCLCRRSHRVRQAWGDILSRWCLSFFPPNSLLSVRILELHMCARNSWTAVTWANQKTLLAVWKHCIGLSTNLRLMTVQIHSHLRFSDVSATVCWYWVSSSHISVRIQWRSLWWQWKMPMSVCERMLPLLPPMSTRKKAMSC